jgi:CRISPR/Cas system-associated protein endoribonuclease Cas2
MGNIERNPVDTVADLLHTGGPPLNADDAALAILDALVKDGFVVLRAEVHARAVEENERLRAHYHRLSEERDAYAARAVKAERQYADLARSIVGGQ